MIICLTSTNKDGFAEHWSKPSNSQGVLNVNKSKIFIFIRWLIDFGIQCFLCPSGGMVDATDLKSVGDLSPCRFKSGPGYHFSGSTFRGRTFRGFGVVARLSPSRLFGVVARLSPSINSFSKFFLKPNICFVNAFCVFNSFQSLLKIVKPEFVRVIV